MAADKETSALLFSRHLLVVTESRVLSFDARGVQQVFASRKGKIRACKESSNGDGKFAIADEQGLSIYTRSVGQLTTHAVPGVQGLVQQLAFSSSNAPTAHNGLFFSTTTQNAVQHYSIKERRMLSNGPRHAHPPSTFAVSHNARLLLSVSEGPPPTIYLQNLELASAPCAVVPRVSSAPAVCADFHPRRPNIFLLGFKDGSLGVYDATRIENAALRSTQQRTSSRPEIKSFLKLHHAVPSTLSQAGTSKSITALFLPHNRSQIITGGTDGKCNIVDFEKGIVIKSWHAKAPISHLSILRTIEPQLKDVAAGKLRKPNAEPQRSSTIVAVGRVDGKVLLFDEQGSILAERLFNDIAARVIDIEFMQGKSPEPFVDHAHDDKMTMHINVEAIEVDLPDHPTEDLPVGIVHSKFKEHLSRSFMEIGEAVSTVKHNDLAALSRSQLALPAQRGYMDLFSPIKQPAIAIRSSPPRSRPRITSTTYVQRNQHDAEESPSTKQTPSPQAIAKLTQGHWTTRAGLLIGNKCAAQVTQPNVHTIHQSLSLPSGSNEKQGLSTTPSAALVSQRLGSVPAISSGLLVSYDSHRPSPASSRSTSNSKILADLQRLGQPNKIAGVRKIGGNLAMFAPGYTLKHHDNERPLSISSTNSCKSAGRKSAKLTLNAGKRASIGRVKVQQPFKTRPRPRGINMKAEDIFLAETHLMTPRLPKETVANADGSVEFETQSSSSMPSHDPEAQVRSTFSSDSSLIESSHSNAHKVGNHSERVNVAPPVSLLSTAALAGEDTSSSATPIAVRSQTTSTESIAEPPVLLPGFAESYHGPVEVAAYLPRRNSLKFSTPTKPNARGREPMSDVRTTSPRRNGGGYNWSPVRKDGDLKSQHKLGHQGDCLGCVELREEMAAIKKRHAALEQEVQALWKLVKGKSSMPVSL